MGFLSSAGGSMLGDLGQAISSVVGLGSDLIGTGINAYANHREADLNRDYQERMSKNAYQYRVADLRAAGLNPVLATGQNVSVPSGATAQGNPASMANSGRVISEILSNTMKKSSEIADSQIAVNAAQAKRLDAEARAIEKDVDYKDLEKWTNALSGAAVGAGGVYAGSKLLTALSDKISNSRSVQGFAQQAEKMSLPQSVKTAVANGGARAKNFLKMASKVGGPVLVATMLTEAMFDKSRRDAEEDKKREEAGKPYKSTFNLDRHF